MAAKTALVVEDDKGIQQLLRDALESEGFQVTCEKDGEWARRALERRLPDVVVTDVLLPSLGGFELIEALRAMPGGKDVPVVVVSGIYKGARHKKNAHEKLGVHAYFDKPFEVKALVDAVRSAAGSASIRVGERSQRRASAPAPVAFDPLADAGAKRERDVVEKQAEAFPAQRTARGNLRAKRFPEVLAQLYRWKSSGALLLKRGKVKKIVYLKDGYPTIVKSNLLSECLGRVMVREKMISEEECERSLLLMKEKGGRQQGTVLIEMGCISPHNLVYALQLQLEAKLFDVFAWDDGEYQFNPNVELPGESVHLDMSAATIVYEGVRRRFPPALLDDVLAPFWDSYLAVHPDPAHRFQEIALEADERKLVALVDGRRTMNEVVERAGLPALQAKQLVYSLIATEAIQAVPRAARKRDFMETTSPVQSTTSRTSPPPLRRRLNSRPDEDPVLPRQGVDGDLSVDELRARLGERARAMRRMSCYEMLGVSKAATSEEIKKAYYAAVREVHPDRLRGVVPADARALADQIHAALTTAYETLADEDRRRDYEQRIAGDGKKGRAAGAAQSGDEVGRILAAEGKLKKGEQALAQEDWAEAAARFAEAVELYPEEGEFAVLLAWARFNEARDDAQRREALALAERGVQQSPRLDRGYVLLGRMLKAAGRPRDAAQRFEQALLCNPDCQEALAELKLKA